MREAWSSPTRTAARPGVIPVSASARTRSATSLRICAAMALPSRMRAVTASILPAAGIASQARRGAAHRAPAYGALAAQTATALAAAGGTVGGGAGGLGGRGGAGVGVPGGSRASAGLELGDLPEPVPGRRRHHLAYLLRS